MNSSLRIPQQQLVLTAIFSGSITLIFSLAYTALTIVAIVFRFNCDVPELSPNTADYFMNVVHRTYILDAECSNAIVTAGITSDYSVFILNTITLCASLMSIIAAALVISAVCAKSAAQYFHLIMFGYVGIVFSSMIVDITFASHFGMDYTFITNNMVESSPIATSYQLDMIRLGAMFFMTMCLKGIVGNFINLVLLVLLVIYTVQFMTQPAQSVHSIHKLGTIDAYETNKRRNNCNHACDICLAQNRNGSQHNYAFINDNDTLRSHSPNRDTLKPEYANPQFNTTTSSNSWQTVPVSSRPFSYLEDARRDPLPDPPASQWRRDPEPASSQWRRDLPTPETPTVPSAWRRDAPPWTPSTSGIPEPDYSPLSPRRLKSAMKSQM